jgi:DNA repair exonuclease SbcCD ATPase subunit
MRILNSATYSLVLGTVLLWVPCSMGAEVDFEAEVKKHMNDPIGCGCSKQDETDLESRIKQVEAAIKEYESQIKEWEAKEKNAKETLFLTNDNRGSVQGSVGFRMSTVRTANARSFAAETDAGCTTKIDPDATSCLRGALQDHESVHKKACEANKSLNPFVDWRDKQRVVDYMKEEQAGYRKESERLQQELQKMKKYCSLDKSIRWALERAAADRDRLKEAYENVDGLRKVLR